MRKLTIAALLLLLLALATPTAVAPPAGDCSGVLGILACILEGGFG